MAAVNVTLVGTFTSADGTSVGGTFTGSMHYTDLGIGGGPAQPPLGIWGPTDPRPTPPIYLPPGGGGQPPGVPTHPIVIPPTPPGTDPPQPAHPIVLPPVPPDPPQQPPGSGMPPPGWSWHWQDPPGAWLLVYNPPESGKPQPPGAGAAPPPRR